MEGGCEKRSFLLQALFCLEVLEMCLDLSVHQIPDPKSHKLIRRVVVQTLEVEPIRGLEVALDHAASTAFQISGAVLCLTRSLSSLN
jgi:hypothetical protein